MADYSGLIDAAAGKYGIPADILRRVASTESGDNPNAVSPKGAEGIMQLGEAAAKDSGVSDRFDPAQSIDGGARYLRAMYDQFHDWPVALAAYNAGPGAVRKHGNQIPDYPETQAYVRKVMGGNMDAAKTAPAAGAADPLAGMLQESPEEKELDKRALKSLDEAEADRAEAKKGSLEDIRRYEQMLAEPPPEVPKPPSLKAMPDAPDDKDYIKDPKRVMGQFFPVLAVLGSLATRKSATTAMMAATEAINSAKSQDKEAYERANTKWKQSTEKALHESQQEIDRYNEALENVKLSNAERQQKLQVAAALSDSKMARVALSTGNFEAIEKMKNMLEASRYKIAQVYSMAQYREDQLKLHEEALNDAKAKVPPTTQAYDDAVQRAKSGGATDEEARRAGLVALKEAEYAAHPTAQAAAGRAEERTIQSDKRTQIYQNTRQQASEIDSVTPEEMNTASGQIRILDAFTKLATGGQAIRQFMASSMTKYMGWVNTAEALKQRTLTTKGAIMGEAAAKQYYEAAKEMNAEIMKVYDKSLAEHAQKIEARGEEPGQAIDGDDLQRIISEGLYTPKAAGAAPGQQPAAPTPAPAPAPGPAVTPGAPKVGTVQKGYVFLGGNPADQKSWAKVQ
jgi:hypothetical protein